MAMERDLVIRLERARDLIASTIEAPLSLREVADEAFLSQFHFHRLFSGRFGETPHEFLTRRRIDLAKKLLAENELTVTEICFALGYESLGTFSDKFKRLTGLSPSEYRRRLIFHFAHAPVRSHRFVPYCFVSPSIIRKIEEAPGESPLLTSTSR
jgi:AraC-like DNA-binding protein